jgi:AcrR family transcriptional regulator
MPSSRTTKKAPRRYNATGRRADAEARQQRTVDAAARLFVGQGYGATSVADIADAAKVSPQFVYAAFESKAGVLARAVDYAVAGDTVDVPIAARPAARITTTHPDIDQRVEAMVSLLRASHERAAPLVHLVETASATDNALSQLADKLTEQLRKDLRGFAKALPPGTLRSGVTPQRAGDILYALGAPRTWTTLVDQCGWTAREYEAWLIDTIKRTLLG